MPTNFTVVPVKDNARKAKQANGEENVDDNNVPKEEEDITGEIKCCSHLFLITKK